MNRIWHKLLPNYSAATESRIHWIITDQAGQRHAGDGADQFDGGAVVDVAVPDGELFRLILIVIHWNRSIKIKVKVKVRFNQVKCLVPRLLHYIATCMHVCVMLLVLIRTNACFIVLARDTMLQLNMNIPLTHSIPTLSYIPAIW